MVGERQPAMTSARLAANQTRFPIAMKRLVPSDTRGREAVNQAKRGVDDAERADRAQEPGGQPEQVADRAGGDDGRRCRWPRWRARRRAARRAADRRGAAPRRTRRWPGVRVPGCSCGPPFEVVIDSGAGCRSVLRRVDDLGGKAAAQRTSRHPIKVRTDTVRGLIRPPTFRSRERAHDEVVEHGLGRRVLQEVAAVVHDEQRVGDGRRNRAGRYRVTMQSRRSARLDTTMSVRVPGRASGSNSVQSGVV